MIRYPEWREVERIITYRKHHVDMSSAIASYGARYEKEINETGRNPYQIADIIDFIRSSYIDVIHRNSNGRLGKKSGRKKNKKYNCSKNNSTKK